MVRGNIFLNTSLTEAFCMAIIEAASCGLLVVSTKVGGIPEVLPHHMIRLCRPQEDDLTATLQDAIDQVAANIVDTTSFHEEIAQMYSWSDVAERTERVYLRAMNDPTRDHSLFYRLCQYYGCGELLGKIVCMLLVVDHVLLLFLEWLVPTRTIDIAPDFVCETYGEELARAYKAEVQI